MQNSVGKAGKFQGNGAGGPCCVQENARLSAQLDWATSFARTPAQEGSTGWVPSEAALGHASPLHRHNHGVKGSGVPPARTLPYVQGLRVTPLGHCIGSNRLWQPRPQPLPCGLGSVKGTPFTETAHQAAERARRCPLPPPQI